MPLAWVTGNSGVGKSAVGDLLAVCVVVDDDPLRHRPPIRTTNAFGRHPEELAAALEDKDAAEVADAVLAAAGRVPATRDGR